MKRLFSFIRYSGIWVGLILNPFHWRLHWVLGSKEWPDNYLHEISFFIGPVYIRVVIDDGSW